MRWFVRQAAYGGRVCAFNQSYKSKSCDDILKIISKESCVKGNDSDIIEAFMKYKNKQFKVFEKEYEDQFNDYRDENVEDKEKYINEKLSKLTLHKIINRTNWFTYCGISMLLVYIHLLCGIQSQYILKKKLVTLSSVK